MASGYKGNPLEGLSLRSMLPPSAPPASPPRQLLRPAPSPPAYTAAAPFTSRPFLDVWLAQAWGLMIKCLAMVRFKWAVTLAIVVLPSICAGALYGMITALQTTEAAAQTLSLPRCTALNVYGSPYTPASSCVTVLYAPSGDATVAAVMARLAESTGLSLGSDIVGVASADAAAGYMYDNSFTQVDASVVFTSSSAATAQGQVEYSLWYNASLPSAYARLGLDDLWKGVGVSGRYAALQAEVDAALVHVLTGSVAGGGRTIDITIGQLPDFEDANTLVGSASNSLVILLLAGPTLLVMGVVCGALMVLMVITGEKSRRLVGQLRTIGLFESAYWATWFASYAPVIFCMALLTPAVGVASGTILFAHVAFSVHLVATLLLGAAYAANAMCCASMVRQQRCVSGAAFFLFAAAVTITTVFAAVGLYPYIYGPFIPMALQVFVALFPCFHYGRLMNGALIHVFTANNVGGGVSAAAAAAAPAALAASGLLPQQAQARALAALAGAANVSLGAPSGLLGAAAAGFATFTWDDLSVVPPPSTINKDGLPVVFNNTAPSFNLWMLVVLTIGYLCLAWYFGQVMTGDLGAAEPFYFPLSPWYWGCAVRRGAIEPGDTLAATQELSRLEGSVRVHKLSKSFKKSTALKEVSLSMAPGQLFALLGQNGAGKVRGGGGGGGGGGGWGGGGAWRTSPPPPTLFHPPALRRRRW